MLRAEINFWENFRRSTWNILGPVYPAHTMLNWLRGGLLLRRVLQELSGIRQALRRQGDALERLAQQFAPLGDAKAPRNANATEVADTGVSHLDVVDAGLVEDYVARVQRETGHTPEGDEILAYLADEKTLALAERLRQREAEVLLARTERDRVRAEQGG